MGVFVAMVLLQSAGAVGQAPAPAPLACAKTISFAIAEGGQPVPAIPRFAGKWIGKKYHVKGYPGLCLSQIPSSSTANYVVIFSTSDASFDELTPSAHTYSSTGPLSGSPASVSSYGGTWNYSYTAGLPGDTTSSIDPQKADVSRESLVLRAYNQQGRLVSHYSVDGNHSREKLLEQVIADIQDDKVETSTNKRIAAPLSVYYVNCDVDSPIPASQVASTGPPIPAMERESMPKLTPVPATLDFWSNPAGADIYLDGSYIGKSPFTASVVPGEHVVIMRKPDFGAWSRKIQVAAGSRRIAAYLERKFLTLPAGQP
jgi:hypothetical protein